MTGERGRVRPEDLLQTTTRRAGDTDERLVVEVSGEVDLHTAPMFGDALAAALARGPALIVVDLTDVSFLASIGITILLKARRSTRLRVVTPEHSGVARTLRLTGVDEVLGLVSGRADALTP
ncbi:STAS domain-containing protein [Amycolatopsis australiensis]|uniref:Anti-sigma factor antagonist n=1 Tax=Amycolatopsis australiensis TaxID=546364 RepID=A0A1K1S4Y5_9PSEU|nr:STAS domain-containing protein [Amycolatopsis australiensis]SFW79135.1 anti-anti-sigma factor [Amycolatopsis australiensis]